jgi:hypothetical protein
LHFFRLSRSVSAHTRNAHRQQKLQIEIAKKQKTPPGQFRPTTSAAGYAVIAADLGLPPRFNTPAPVPSPSQIPKVTSEIPNAEPQRFEISNLKSEICTTPASEPAKTTDINQGI